MPLCISFLIDENPSCSFQERLHIEWVQERISYLKVGLKLKISPYFNSNILRLLLSILPFFLIFMLLIFLGTEKKMTQ